MRIAALLLVLLPLAGCLDPLEDRLRAGDVEPPRWKVGDWWTYTFSSDVYGSTAEVTVVVANTSGAGYVLGFPADADATIPLLQHMPALGPVREDLSYDVHETRFEPLRWPLEDGLAWETTWIQGTVHLTARLVNGTWNVTNAGFEEDDGMRYDILYDPERGNLQSFKRTGLDGRVRQSIELTANGTGHQGELRAPGAMQVLLLEARTRGTLGAAGPTPPNPTFTPPDNVDTILVGCLAGGSVGQYHAEVRSPTGVICALDETVPPGDAVVRAQIVEAPTEAGAWEARLLAIGDGLAVAEVLGYLTETYTLA